MDNSAGQMKSLWVQGWVGINHSYAMVNQYQLLALTQMPQVQLFYSELPAYDPRWTKATLGAGFSPAEQALLAGIAPHQDEPISAIYRIHTPNTLQLAAHKIITFMVTEFGLDERWFTPQANVKAYVDSGNMIATPSHWSRDRIVEYGFDAASVYVVPHGVDGQRFKPMGADERMQARAALGYTPEDVVFLNVGAPMWNKGMDLVFEAFFKIRQKHKNAKLLVKDQQALYGVSAVTMVQNLAASGKVRIDGDDVAAVRLIPTTLSLEQLRSLYCVADYYVSPYRAEGFNLPVIEAIASGTKVIVTDGGSTDDFCDENTAIKIPASLHRNTEMQGYQIGAHLQPDIDALVDIMDGCMPERASSSARFAFGRTDLLEKFTWARASRLIAALA